MVPEMKHVIYNCGPDNCSLTGCNELRTANEIWDGESWRRAMGGKGNGNELWRDVEWQRAMGRGKATSYGI